MHHSNSACRFCETEALCRKTENDCRAYHEYYRWGDYPEPALKPLIDPAPASAAENRLEKVGLMNRMTGRIVNIVEGDYMAQVTVEVDDKLVSSIMPIDKFKASGKKELDEVTVVFKAMNVKIMQ